MAEKDILKKKIAERLKLARELSGLSQAQAAKVLNVSRPSISEIEAARRNVTGSELVQFSEIYDVETSWLLCKEDIDQDFAETKIQLAARELSKMSDGEREKLFKLLSAMKRDR